MSLHFINAKIYRDGKFFEGELWVDKGIVTEWPQENVQVIDVGGNFLVPGFIDLQINGAFGQDFTNSPNSVVDVSKQLGEYGVTSFLATAVSSTHDVYENVLPLIRKHIGKTQGAELLGIHLEGPCFNPVQAKAHNRNAILKCGEYPTPRACYGDLEGVKLVTLAPEVPIAARWIEELKNQGIVVSAGHTMASAVEMKTAMQQGVSMATHLFNGMGPMHHREPGVVGAVLGKKGFFYSIIADGVHVAPEVLKIMWQAQPEGLILVSDAVAATGLSEGCFSLGGVDIEISNGVVRRKDTGELAGCAQGLSGLVANFCKFTGAPIGEAIRTVTEKPARVLGIYPKKGALEVGSDADIVIMDHDLRVVSTYVRGTEAWSFG